MMYKKEHIFSGVVLTAGLLILLVLCGSYITDLPEKDGTLKINFINTANRKPIVLRDSSYTTAAGETYTVSKLRYYISNIQVDNFVQKADENNYHLIDLARKTDLNIPLKDGKYKQIRFILGVDSARNCSGAQTGALDPMNDMFWTWNSGYVMFKLEGTSPSSNADLNRVEHHIGGYRFGNNVATTITLNADDIKIKSGETTVLDIEMNLDQYWKSSDTIRIAADPICTLPGALAKKLAGSFPFLFSIQKISKPD